MSLAIENSTIGLNEKRPSPLDLLSVVVSDQLHPVRPQQSSTSAEIAQTQRLRGTRQRYQSSPVSPM